MLIETQLMISEKLHYANIKLIIGLAVVGAAVCHGSVRLNAHWWVGIAYDGWSEVEWSVWGSDGWNGV